MTTLPSITEPLTLGTALRAGYQRVLAKLAGYRAAIPSPTTTIGTRIGTNSNSTMATIQRVGMMFTAEDVAKNSPISAAYLSARVNYCSSQLVYIPDTGDTKLDADLKEYLQGDDGTEGVWGKMGANSSMQAAFLRTADIELPVRGDSGMFWHRDSMGNLKLGEFSADQLGEPYSYTGPRITSLATNSDGQIVEVAPSLSGGNRLSCFCGRYMDASGECVAYKILERVDSWYGNPRILSAMDVLFFQDPASFRGIRGVTKFANALQHMEKGERLFQIGMDAAMRQAKTSFAVFNERGAPDEATYENQTYTDGRVVSRERINDGPLVEYFYNGDKVQATSADSPGPELIAGCEYSDARVALALGLNYAFLVSPEKVGGAPSRLEINKASKELTRIQNLIHRPHLNKIRTVTILDAVNRGYFPAHPRLLKGVFMLPISPTVDAFYDAKENIAMLRSGLESPQEIVAETNRNWNTVMRHKTQAAMDVARATEDANKQLKSEGYKLQITANDVMQLSDNPQQATVPADESALPAPETAQLATYKGDKGVWRTIRGRAIFIKEGETLKEALGENDDDDKEGEGSGAKKADANDATKKSIGSGDPKSHSDAIEKNQDAIDSLKKRIRSVEKGTHLNAKEKKELIRDYKKDIKHHNAVIDGHEKILESLDRTYGAIERGEDKSDLGKLAAYMGDITVADLPESTRLDIARIMGTNGNTDALRVIKYGMVASELERMADPHNLESARKNLRYCTNGSCADEVHANAEKHILLNNGRVVDGHHYLARALKGKVSKSLFVVDLTPARFQTASLALAKLDADFEAKHPRDEDGKFSEDHEMMISQQKQESKGNKYKAKALKDSEKEARQIPPGTHEKMADDVIAKVERELATNKPHVIDAGDMLRSENAMSRHIGGQMHDAVIDPKIHAAVTLDFEAKRIQDYGKIGKVYHPDAFKSVQKIRDAKERLGLYPKDDEEDE